jgi:hypothetical protein
VDSKVLIGAGFFDILRELFRAQAMEWMFQHFGRHGKWLIANPFSLLTIAVVDILLWLGWNALKELLVRESVLVGPHQQKIYRPRFSSSFTAGLIVGVVVCTGCIVYGAYRYYSTPLPIIVGVTHPWFARNYKNADLYIVLIMKNYSDVPVKIKVEQGMTAFGQPILQIADPEAEAAMTTLVPWEEHTLHFSFWFFGNSMFQDAYAKDNLRPWMNITYNDGKRDVTYRYVGRIESFTVAKCSQCPGNIDTVQEEWN